MYVTRIVPNVGMVEIVILGLFVAWCAGVVLFLRYLSTRAKKAAAEPEAGRQELDELIAKIGRASVERDSKP